MYSLTLFEALFITHVLMDWIFQWRWEAMNKSKSWTALFFHCAVYTIGFLPVLFIYDLHFSWLMLVFTSHVIFDKRNFEFWILEKFKGFRKQEMDGSLFTISLIGVDQVLHIAILALIVIFS